MKIYLLITLIGTILAAVHFTRHRNGSRKRFPNSASAQVRPAQDQRRVTAHGSARGNIPFPAKILLHLLLGTPD